ncbi:MAG: DUF5009 domain-containing protein [Bacteroidales bacterium]|nr:DUF5009 domain-containing protein [Bacteroidales bacterium]
MENRCLSLDFLRGISIFGMIFSAIIPYGVLPAWMYHIQNPPPLHNLDVTVSGIGWVDLVFPVFIFCMGVAIPLSGKKKMEQGVSAMEYVKGCFGRFLMLWLFSYLYVLMNFSTAEGLWPQIFTIFGFVALGSVYGKRVGKNLWMRVIGLIIVGCIITIGHFGFGEVVSFHRRGIIIFLLAFLYLFGSLIWYSTRRSLKTRVAVFIILFLFTCITKELEWPAITYANPNIRWWFNMEYFYFLLILLPATVIGDILSERAELSFNEGVLDDDVIPLCSAMAAKEEGDARYALDLLKSAGELAFDEESERVTSEHVRKAKDTIEHNKIIEIISTLPLQQQRVLEAILNLTKLGEEISSGK